MKLKILRETRYKHRFGKKLFVYDEFLLLYNEFLPQAVIGALFYNF